jgi:hypothetical protein
MFLGQEKGKKLIKQYLSNKSTFLPSNVSG